MLAILIPTLTLAFAWILLNLQSLHYFVSKLLL